MKKTKGYTIFILLMVVCVLFTGINSSASVFSWATDLAPAKSANRYTHNYYGDWSNTDYSELYYNAGVYTRVEYTGSAVVVETYDSSFKITSSKKIGEMPLNCYMGSYMGATYNFLVYGLNRTVTLNMASVNTCCVVKYDKDWNELGKYYYQSTAASIGAQDVTDFAENGDILYIEATETRSNGHEFSICLEFNSTDNTLTKSSVFDSRTHRMSSYILTDGDSMLNFVHSDADPRGLGFFRKESSWRRYCAGYITLADQQTNSGVNYTGMTIGGAVVSNQHYLIAYSDMKEKYKIGEKTDNSSYIRLAIVKKESMNAATIKSYDADFTTVGNLTTLDLGTSSSYTICPYIVHWKDDKYVIMWDSGSAQGVNYVIYTDDTQTVSDVKTLSEPTLSDVTPLSVNGNIVWYATGGIYENGAYTRIHPLLPSDWNSAPIFYILNPETGACATEGQTPKIFTYAEMNPTTATTITAVKTETTTSANEVTIKPETSTETPAANTDVGQENADYSKQISAAKKKKAKISKVTNVKGRKIKVTIKKASGYKFQIKISTSKKFKKNVKTYKTSKKTYTTKKRFSKGKTYYVKVRTYKKINGTTYYGKWSAVKKVKIKK